MLKPAQNKPSHNDPHQPLPIPQILRWIIIAAVAFCGAIILSPLFPGSPLGSFAQHFGSLYSNIYLS